MDNGIYLEQAICVVGRSATGKTTIAKSIGKELGLPVFSLGEYQREKFTAYGDPLEYHKKLGLNTTYFNMWDEYIEEVCKRRSQDGIVVDGIYSAALLERMNAATRPDTSCTIHVRAPKTRRLQLFMLRRDMDEESAMTYLEQYDKIKIDVGLIQLIKSADSTIINNGSLQSVVKDALRKIAAIRGDMPVR